MADTTLTRMAKFDFTVPVKTVMLFEDDSDEDSCPSTKKQKPNDPKSNENIPEVEPVAATDTNSDLKELHQMVNNCILAYFALDEANACKLTSDKLTQKEDTRNEDKADNNWNEQQQSLDKTSKAVSDTENATTEITTEKIHRLASPKNHTELNKLRSYLKTSEDTKSTSNNSARKKDRRKKDKVENHRNDPKPPLDQSSKAATITENATTKTLLEQIHTIASPNNNTELNTLRSYFQKLKDSVSVYLAVIVRAYHCYLNAVKSREKYVIEHIKKHFIHIKQHLFKLSYTSVETIFIPEENNEAFVRSFIESTVNIATKFSVKSSYEEIALLYSELLAWAKFENKSLLNYVYPNKAAQGLPAKIVPMQRIEQNLQNNPQIEKSPANDMIHGRAENQRAADIVYDLTSSPNVVVVPHKPARLPSYEESVNHRIIPTQGKK